MSDEQQVIIQNTLDPTNYLEGMSGEEKVALANSALTNPVLKQVFEDLIVGAFNSFCNTPPHQIDRREQAHRLVRTIHGIQSRLQAVVSNFELETRLADKKLGNRSGGE